MGKKKINKKDLIQRDGLFYKKFTDVPFTGETSQSSFKNGKEIIHGKGEYKNGKREGSWITYWSNGQLYYQGDYNKNGKREGSWVGYYSEGTIWQAFTGTYKNGERIK